MFIITITFSLSPTRRTAGITSFSHILRFIAVALLRLLALLAIVVFALPVVLLPAVLDALFITHAHPDHVGGLNAWWSDSFVPGDPPLDLQGKRVYVPKALSRAGVEPIIVAQPQKIAEGVAAIGAIAFSDLFPLSLKTPQNAEQVLAVNVEGKGIVLIMGCGHPTVERIVAWAQALFDEPVIGLVVGLHYEGMTQEQVQPHIAFVKDLKPQLVAVSPHDSSPAALQAFREAFPDVYQELQVGRAITMLK
ncbi:MAG: MBL fold metallo-hydrolase [Chloroflexi bacterium]|nr:MBL fold metallo-hydrolase [Chloroflexota bacterium]